MVVKEKLTKQVKQLLVPWTDLEGEVVKGMETVAAFHVKLMAAAKHAEDVLYDRDGLLAYLQQSQRRRDKVGERITRDPSTIDRFSEGLK